MITITLNLRDSNLIEKQNSKEKILRTAIHHLLVNHLGCLYAVGIKNRNFYERSCPYYQGTSLLKRLKKILFLFNTDYRGVGRSQISGMSP